MLSSLSRSRILIVADVLENAHFLASALGEAGHAVETIAPRELGVEPGQVKTPDLILLDTDLENEDEYAIYQALKVNIATQNIPVIFILTQEKSVDRGKVFAVGGVDYLLQPLLLPELLAKVATQLTLHQIQQPMWHQRVERILKSSSLYPLLSSLQKQLHQQAAMLQEKNLQLQQEIRERQRAQEALKLQQEKSEQLLLSILPRPIAEQLKHEPGTTIAEQFDNVTILFADIVDFTPLSSRTCPLQLVNLLNDVFSTFDALAEKFGLEKIKTIGDAYMAACGIPIPRPDHAEAVMEMAIAMRQEVSRFTLESGKPIRVRIGMNTGTVVAGVIGATKFSYDLWGDAVNIASRMESQGLPGKIQLTEATYEQLKDKYHFEKWGNLNVKGKGNMTTYLLIGRRE